MFSYCVPPDLLTHGHWSRLSVSVQLHGLHGRGSFTAEGTLVQDGVKHLAGAQENTQHLIPNNHFILPY